MPMMMTTMRIVVVVLVVAVAVPVAATVVVLVTFPYDNLDALLYSYWVRTMDK